MGQILELTSRENPAVKRLAALLRDSASRREQRRLVLEGERACCDAFRDGAAIRFWLFSQEAWKSSGLAGIRRLLSGPAASGDIKIATAPSSVLAHIADVESPNDSHAMIAEVEWPAGGLDVVVAAAKRSGRIAVLDRIQDPGNVGTILRTAEAMGVDCVAVTSGTSDPYGPKALRASAGSALRMGMARDVSTAAVARALSSAGFKVFVTTPREGRAPFDTDLSGPAAFVFGNEGRGVSEGDWPGATKLSVPVSGRAESLNVAAAAAAVLYESARPRTLQPAAPERGRARSKKA